MVACFVRRLTQASTCNFLCMWQPCFIGSSNMAMKRQNLQYFEMTAAQERSQLQTALPLKLLRQQLRH